MTRPACSEYTKLRNLYRGSNRDDFEINAQFDVNAQFEANALFRAYGEILAEKPDAVAVMQGSSRYPDIRGEVWLYQLKSGDAGEKIACSVIRTVL